jgi:hypothetical protein
VALYLGSEKDGIVTQLDSWFGDLGLPLLALGGYSSQTYCDDIVSHVGRGRRPAILLYAGDHDPSGWDIPRDFIDKTNCWDDVHRIALTPEQVEEYQLPESIGKEADPRTPAFIERFGSLVQVEMDALEPDVLRGLYQDAIDRYWHTEAYEAALTREEADRAELARRWQL